MTKTKAIIVDLDGTLALLKRDPYATELCIKDELNIPVAEVVRKFAKEYKILIVSGREENHKDITIKWLKLYRIPYAELCMRPIGDHQTTGVELKKQVYNSYILPKYEVLFALDDMFKVAEMYREQGIACFQVAKEEFLKKDLTKSIVAH